MQTPLSINHRPGNPVRGKAKGLRLNSPAWLCRRRRDRRGGTTHGPGPAGGTPLSVRTPCRGRPRHDELPENESGRAHPEAAYGAGPAARSGGSAAFSAPRAPGRGLGCQPGAESGSQARLRAPQTARRLLPQLS